MLVTYGPRRENMSLVFSKNKSLDQYAHPCRLIGAFVICLFESIIYKHADGAHGIGVQKVTSNCNVATLISSLFSLYLARRLASGETFILW